MATVPVLGGFGTSNNPFAIGYVDLNGVSIPIISNATAAANNGDLSALDSVSGLSTEPGADTAMLGNDAYNAASDFVSGGVPVQFVIGGSQIDVPTGFPNAGGSGTSSGAAATLPGASNAQGGVSDAAAAGGVLLTILVLGVLVWLLLE